MRGFRRLWLHLQVPFFHSLVMPLLSETDVAALFNRLITRELPDRRGLGAWTSLLKAHATLMRQLETELCNEVGLPLADFDVLALLAIAGGQMRMTELAAQALGSRSGMTRRVDRLVREGLVRRATVEADGRGVVVGLTDAGLARLTEAAPVHVRGVSKLFVDKLEDQELAQLEGALDKVTLDCSFG
jgi:DNA-binding MarR family transcriptional regulator